MRNLLTSARFAAIVGVAIVALKIALSVPQLGGDLATVAITWFVVTAFVAVGVALFATDIPTINGWACLAVAAATLPGDLNNPAYPQALVQVGFVLEPLYLAAAVALVLRYPHRSLRRSGRVIVYGLVTSAVLMRIPLVYTHGELPSPLNTGPDRLVLGLDPWWHDWVFLRAGYTCTTVLLVCAGCLLIVRATTSHGVTRQSLAPLAVVGATCALTAALDQVVWVLGTPGAAWAGVALARNLSAAAIPVALMADLLRRRSASAAVTSEILLAAGTGDLGLLEGALRHVLLDQSLTVAAVPTARPESSSIAGSAPVGSGAPGEARKTVILRSSEVEPVAVVEYDPSAIGYQALLSSALSAAELGLEKARLTLALLDRMAELEASRARIVEAGLAERRRVERNLHDGAQQQFLAVMATLAKSDFATDTQMRDLVADARAGLSDAVAELRQLARGIHPATLSQGGLGAALPSLCRSAPEAVSLRLDSSLSAQRPEPDIESAVYFVVAEALVNVTRYAQATSAVVTVAQEGGSLTVEVTDDGNGRAHFTPLGGLTGLRDRVQALGGDIALHRDPCAHHRATTGSQLRVRFPLTATPHDVHLRRRPEA